MRLWHYKLIPVLPRQQLLGQWRECCLIAKELSEKGTPNHILVNPVTQYPIEEFKAYCGKVLLEMQKRGYSVTSKDFADTASQHDDLFSGWHNDRYMWQCYHNLEEKYDRGGLTENEWDTVREYCLYYHDSEEVIN